MSSQNNREKELEFSEGDLIKINESEGISDKIPQHKIAVIDNISIIEFVSEFMDDSTLLYIDTGETKTEIDASKVSFTVLNEDFPPKGVITESVIESMRDEIEDSFTFSVSLTPDDIFNYINAQRPDGWKIDGNIKGITEGKIVLDIGDKYITVREDVWLSNFGADEIVDVSVKNGKFVAELFAFRKLKRHVFRWVDENLPTQIYIDSLDWVDDDPNIHLKLYCKYNQDCQVNVPDSGKTHKYK